MLQHDHVWIQTGWIRPRETYVEMEDPCITDHVIHALVSPHGIMGPVARVNRPSKLDTVLVKTEFMNKPQAPPVTDQYNKNLTYMCIRVLTHHTERLMHLKHKMKHA